MIEEKNGCLHPLMKLSENYLELICKLDAPEFKEAREELEKIYTRGQNLIYNSKDYKEMTKAFVSSAYELVMAYRAAISPKPEKTESDQIAWLNYDTTQIDSIPLDTMYSYNTPLTEPKDPYTTINDSLNTEYKLDFSQFAQNIFNTKPTEKEVNKLNYINKDMFNHYKDQIYNVKKVEV